MGNILMKGNIFFSLYPLWVTYWWRGIFFFHFTPNSNILMKGNIFFSLYPLWFTYWLRGIFFFHFIPNGWHIDQGAYFFFIVDLLLNVRVRFRKGKIFFSFWSIYGTFFFTRKTVKALRARSARFARSVACASLG